MKIRLRRICKISWVVLMLFFVGEILGSCENSEPFQVIDVDHEKTDVIDTSEEVDALEDNNIDEVDEVIDDEVIDIEDIERESDVVDETTDTEDVESEPDAVDEVIDIEDIESEPDVVVDECSSDSAAGLMGCVESARYYEDLVFVAQERTSGSAHWQQVQDLCFERFNELGFATERWGYGSGINVIGTIEGTEHPEEIVLVSAHYDHIWGCNGANDNASGVAGLLEAARVLSMSEHSRTLVVSCWDEEEIGLLGSAAYADYASSEDLHIVANYVLDMIGYINEEPGSQTLPMGIDILFPSEAEELLGNDSRADFLVVLSNVSANESSYLVKDYSALVGLRTVVLELPLGTENLDLFSDLQRSDHAPFWRAGYPAMLISDTGELRSPYYHCMNGADNVDTLNTDFAVNTVQAIVGSATDMLN